MAEADPKRKNEAGEDLVEERSTALGRTHYFAGARGALLLAGLTASQRESPVCV